MEYQYKCLMPCCISKTLGTLTVCVDAYNHLKLMNEKGKYFDFDVPIHPAEINELYSEFDCDVLEHNANELAHELGFEYGTTLNEYAHRIRKAQQTPLPIHLDFIDEDLTKDEAEAFAKALKNHGYNAYVTNNESEYLQHCGTAILDTEWSRILEETLN